MTPGQAGTGVAERHAALPELFQQALLLFGVRIWLIEDEAFFFKRLYVALFHARIRIARPLQCIVFHEPRL